MPPRIHDGCRSREKLPFDGQARGDVVTCLVTGNLQPIGWAKMEALGLKSLFTSPPFGGEYLIYSCKRVSGYLGWAEMEALGLKSLFTSPPFGGGSWKEPVSPVLCACSCGPPVHACESEFGFLLELSKDMHSQLQDDEGLTRSCGVLGPGFGSDHCSGDTRESWRDRAELVRIAAKRAQEATPGERHDSECNQPQQRHSAKQGTRRSES